MKFCSSFSLKNGKKVANRQNTVCILKLAVIELIEGHID